MAQRKAAQRRVAAKPPERISQVKVKRIRRPADVRRYLTKPVDIGRDGKIKGMRIAVPLPGGGKDRYLVLEVPREALQQLMERAKGSHDIRNWIIQNQKGMLEEYMGHKKKPKTFTFKLLPITLSRIGPREIIPKKTERVPAMPKTIAKKRPKLPKEIRRGNGTRAMPYHVYLGSKRKAKGGIGYEIIPAPFTFKVAELKVYFNVDFTVNQLAWGSRNQTLKELRRVFRAAILCHAAQRGHEVGPGSDIHVATRDAMSKLGKFYDGTMRSALKTAKQVGREDILKYLRTH